MPARHVTRQTAVVALRDAAGSQDVHLTELTVQAYRAFRVRRRSTARLPSDLAISLLFGGWQHACREASAAQHAPQPVGATLAASQARRRDDPEDPRR